MTRIAVTSMDLEHITPDAAYCHKFIIYKMADGEAEELERLQLPVSMAILHALDGSPHPLDEIDILVTRSIDKRTAARVEARNVRIITTAMTEPLMAALALAAGEQLPAG